MKPCEDRMCLNGGKCKMFPNDELDIGCDCPANYTGIYCENSKLLPIYIYILWIILKLTKKFTHLSLKKLH